MDFQDGFMTSASGIQLYCKYWKPVLRPGQMPRALVFVCHGYAEHCLCYRHVAKALTDQGCFVFSHDHEGHGLSEGDRVQISHFRVYVRDVVQHMVKIKAAIPGVPVFIVGHSMGGLIALLASLERPDIHKGIVLIAPAIELNPENATPFKKLMVKILASAFTGLRVGEVDPKTLSRDPDIVKENEEDPLVWHGKLKVGHSLQFLESMDVVKSRMNEISCPILIQHGTADMVTDISGSRMLNQEASSTDKTLSIYQDAYHQLHNEAFGVKERCLQELTDWILQRA